MRKRAREKEKKKGLSEGGEKEREKVREGEREMGGGWLEGRRVKWRDRKGEKRLSDPHSNEVSGKENKLK